MLTEQQIANMVKPLTTPSIEAWNGFWPLDGEQRREMAAMLASFAAMVLTHHAHRFIAVTQPGAAGQEP